MVSDPYDLMARVYDLQHRAFTADVPMYLALAREAARARGANAADVLEIGCGTGRILLPLLEAGHRVVGVDLSEGMLAVCRENIAAGKPALGAHRLLCADARELRLDERFDLAVIALNTFLHNLSRDAQLETLRACRAHLRPGGRLVVDLPANDELANQPDDGAFDHEATIIDPAGGSRIEKYVASRVFWADQEQELRYRIEETARDGSTHVQLVGFRLRHVFRHEMDLLLANAGFERCDWAGNYDLSPLSDGSPRMIALAA